MSRLKLGLFIILAATAFALSSCGNNSAESDLIGRWEFLSPHSGDFFHYVVFFPNGTGGDGQMALNTETPGLSQRGFNWTLSGNRLRYGFGRYFEGDIEFLDNPDLLLFTLRSIDGEPIENPAPSTLARVPVSHDPYILIGSWGNDVVINFEFLPNGEFIWQDIGLSTLLHTLGDSRVSIDSHRVLGDSPATWSVSDDRIIVRQGTDIVIQWFYEALNEDAIILTPTTMEYDIRSRAQNSDIIFGMMLPRTN